MAITKVEIFNSSDDSLIKEIDNPPVVTYNGKSTIQPQLEDVAVGTLSIYYKVYKDGSLVFTSEDIEFTVNEPVSTPLILDDYTGAAGAWSLSKLNSNYTGDCLTVEKTGAVTLNVGFVGNELDVSAIETFADGGDVFVKRIYDQSGNGYNFQQDSFSFQAKIASAGTVITKNGKPAIQFDGDYYTQISGITPFNFLHDGTTKYLISSVISYGNITNPDNVYSLIGNNSGTSNETGVYYGYDDRSTVPRNNALVVEISKSVNGEYPVKVLEEDSISPQAQKSILYDVDIANATASERISIYLDDSAVLKPNLEIITPTIDPATRLLQLGSNGQSARVLVGELQELIIWNNDQSANITGIKSNINTRYNIY